MDEEAVSDELLCCGEVVKIPVGQIMPGLSNPGLLMQNALSEADIEHKAELIYLEWPRLAVITVNLSNYLTNLIPCSDGTPLLNKCIVAGVKQYSRARIKPSVGSLEKGMRRQKAYIHGLIKNTHEILTHHVYGLRGDSKWKTWGMIEEPLAPWILTNQFNTIAVAPFRECRHSEERASRKAILPQIVAFSDIAALGLYAGL